MTTTATPPPYSTRCGNCGETIHMYMKPPTLGAHDALLAALRDVLALAAEAEESRRNEWALPLGWHERYEQARALLRDLSPKEEGL